MQKTTSFYKLAFPAGLYSKIFPTCDEKHNGSLVEEMFVVVLKFDGITAFWQGINFARSYSLMKWRAAY